MAAKDLVITLMEKDNYECPNIATVVYKGDDVDFMERIKTALEAHFDAEVRSFTVQNGLIVTDVEFNPPLDAVVSLNMNGEDEKREIEIHQTWLY